MPKIKKNKKNTLFWPIFIWFLGHALWRPLIYVLRQMKGLRKLDNQDKFLEDSSFGSYFRDLQMLA